MIVDFQYQRTVSSILTVHYSGSLILFLSSNHFCLSDIILLSMVMHGKPTILFISEYADDYDSAKVKQ